MHVATVLQHLHLISCMCCVVSYYTRGVSNWYYASTFSGRALGACQQCKLLYSIFSITFSSVVLQLCWSQLRCLQWFVWLPWLLRSTIRTAGTGSAILTYLSGQRDRILYLLLFYAWDLCAGVSIVLAGDWLPSAGVYARTHMHLCGVWGGSGTLTRLTIFLSTYGRTIGSDSFAMRGVYLYFHIVSRFFPLWRSLPSYSTLLRDRPTTILIHWGRSQEPADCFAWLWCGSFMLSVVFWISYIPLYHTYLGGVVSEDVIYIIILSLSLLLLRGATISVLNDWWWRHAHIWSYICAVAATIYVAGGCRWDGASHGVRSVDGDVPASSILWQAIILLFFSIIFLFLALMRILRLQWRVALPWETAM